METDLTPDEQRSLLSLARLAIETRLQGGRPLTASATEAALNRPGGCFVTLKEQEQLRGCIGTFSADQPLAQAVAEMAVAAATGDPRFPPLTLAELARVHIEISVLSPLRKAASIDEIEVGKHGLYLEKDSCRGVLLPQVASEYHWDRTTFLQQTCRKAGLPTNAWQSAATQIYTFTAQILHEPPDSL